MSNVNNEKVLATVNALNGKFENKVANKKDNISGDFTEDNTSYPTVRGAKNHFGQKVTDWSQTPLDTNYPSEKLVKDSIDSLETDLNIDLAVTCEKQTSPDNGFASTYVIKQGGRKVGAKINIMKDQMVRSASVETVGATPTAEETAKNLGTGDSYIKLVVNTADNDSATNLIIPINSLFDLQTGDNTTITLSNGVYSITTGYVESVIDDYLTALTNAL